MTVPSDKEPGASKTGPAAQIPLGENRRSQNLGLIFRLVRGIFPLAEAELDRIRDYASQIHDEQLRKQAFSSLKLKRFHVQGGSAYALYPGADRETLVRFIAAFQTISDYLDNLCDRMNVQEEAAFRQLHLALTDAADPGEETRDYYRHYPVGQDGRYLHQLVSTCKQCIRKLPSWKTVQPTIQSCIELYTDLQAYKHLAPEIRTDRLETWARSHDIPFPDLLWQEFAAASGSTLEIFVLAAAASDPKLGHEEVKTLDAVYFPWICGLHILLDYFIDAEEDAKTGDLNFTDYYSNLKECEERLLYITAQSFEQCIQLKYPGFHRTVVKGLLSLYLSDPKASRGLNRLVSRNLIRAGKASTYYRLCRWLRSGGRI